jgi:hypothetical protein
MGYAPREGPCPGECCFPPVAWALYCVCRLARHILHLPCLSCSQTRCILETDAGYTKATRNPSGEQPYFCLHFARGACARGHECTYAHHVPTAADDAAMTTAKDIFGRDRHSTHRDDMGGVGDMTRDSRTLYVGGLKRLPGEGSR